jgi:Cof subfamily protein (haloacid dehalogenase superfamily)
MRPRLIATDLDGTLLDREQALTPRTVAAVRSVLAAGIGFVLVTARPPRTVAHLAEQLGGGIAALCGNGTILAEFGAADADPESVHGVTTLIHAFPTADAVAIVDQLRPVLPEAGFALETGFEVYFETAFRIGSVTDRRRILTDQLTGIAPQMPSIIKVLARSPERSADEMVAIARATLSVDAEISHSGGRGLLEIAPHGASKASALAWLCERRGIAASEVAAFGDMPNDLPMLRWAGLGHAVANAHPEVLAAAQHVVGHHAEDGVALALEAMLAAA